MLSINLSPLDGDCLLSVSMLPAIAEDIDINMPRETFWNCVNIALNRFKTSIREKRKTALKKMESEARRKRKCR